MKPRPPAAKVSVEAKNTMSRIGNKPVPVPAGVKVHVGRPHDHRRRPMGKLEWEHRPEVSVTYDEQAKTIVVARRDDQRTSRALHGLTRALVANMVVGVTQGYERRLEIQGVGYLAAVQGKTSAASRGIGQRACRCRSPTELTVSVPRPAAHRHQGNRQAEGRPVRRRRPGAAEAGALQGQGHPLRGRAGPPQAGQGDGEVRRVGARCNDCCLGRPRRRNER